jgi:hypothetical protein
VGGGEDWGGVSYFDGGGEEVGVSRGAREGDGWLVGRLDVGMVGGCELVCRRATTAGSFLEEELDSK